MSGMNRRSRGQGSYGRALLAGAVALWVGCKSDPPVQPPMCVAGCANNVLTYCDEAGKAQTEDCSTITDNSGQPATCEYFKDDNDYFCVGDFGGGCGDETLEGRCDGTKVVRCLSTNSEDDGAMREDVETTDCAANTDGYTACAVAPDGFANCAKPGTTGCGTVPDSGECDGAKLSACVDSSVVNTDCAASSKKCGLLADNSGYGCINPTVFKTMPGDPTKAVKGTIVFEKRTVDTSSYESAQKGFAETPTLTPVRLAQVQIIDDTGTEIQRTFTDEDGAFTLHLPAATTRARVVVSTSANPELYPLSVRDCPPAADGSYPAGCDDEEGSVHQWVSTYFTGPTDLGQIVATESSGLAGAFNIFDIMLKGQDFARENFNKGAYPSTPPVTAQWKKGFATSTSYYDGTRIVIQGVVTDTDEFDDPVLMHEFGHYLERAFSVSDSPGGDHDGSPTDPRLAFGEGYGTYIGCRISGSALYFDSSASGISITNLNNVGKTASLTSPRGLKQLMSEYVVGEILWRLDRGTGGDTQGNGGSGPLGSAPIFDVLGGYFKDNPKYNDKHGASGRELTKFIDGLFCRDYAGKAAASTPTIQKVVTADHGFPYDDYAHNLIPIGSCK